MRALLSSIRAGYGSQGEECTAAASGEGGRSGVADVCVRMREQVSQVAEKGTDNKMYVDIQVYVVIHTSFSLWWMRVDLLRSLPSAGATR